MFRGLGTSAFWMYAEYSNRLSVQHPALLDYHSPFLGKSLYLHTILPYVFGPQLL